MHEERLFPPPADFAARAQFKSLADYEKMWTEAAADLEEFWGNLAGELHWFKPYAYNCLDAHLSTPRAKKMAILWEGEPGDQRTLTYEQLHREVCRFANSLKTLGLKAGDRVSIYMPMVPELAARGSARFTR
jgi:acetyl-CoA synthetase